MSRRAPLIPRRRTLLSAAVAVCLFLVLAGPAAAAPPAGGTQESDGTHNTATLKAFLFSNIPVTYHFEYGTTPGLGTLTPERTLAAANGQVQEPITGLSPVTTYFFRVVASNADGTLTGDTRTFTTRSTPPPPPPPFTPGTPEVTTLQASGYNLQGVSATFENDGIINPHGQRGRWGFEWSLYPDFRRFQETADVGGTCGPPDGQGAFEGYNQTSGTDHTDHRVRATCNLGTAATSANENRRTIYYKLGYSAGGCTGTTELGTPNTTCYGAVKSFQIPLSELVIFGSSGTGAAPTARQVVRALLAALRPTGAAAKIGAILKKGFYPAKLAAPSAGKATIVWTKPVAAGTAAASRPVVVAKGAKRIGSAGKTVVKVRLTQKGKALLKKAKRAKTSIKLKAKGSFTPRGGTKSSKTRAIKLKN